MSIETRPSNVETARGLYESFAAGDIEAVLGLMDPDIVLHEAEGFATGGGTRQGRDEIVEDVFARLATEWTDVSVVPERFVEDGETVIVFLNFASTYVETGKSVEFPGVHVFEFDDGKIVEWTSYSDTALFNAAMETSDRVPLENRERVERGIDAINAQDWETLAELHAADAVFHATGGDVTGVDAIIAGESAYFDAFPDLTVIPETIVAEDDLVVVRMTVTGTHEGTFGGVEPTGREVSYAEMAMFRIDDGKVAEIWPLTDRYALFGQLGVDGVRRIT